MVRDLSGGHPPVGWFASLVGAHVDALFSHVRLIYPLVNAEETVWAVFERAHAEAKAPAVGERAWLRRLARQLVGEGEVEAARLNADAARYGLYGAIDAVDGHRSQLEGLVFALGGLSVRDQEVLRLSSVEDLELDELAWILEVDSDDIADVLEAARQRFREAYSGACER